MSQATPGSSSVPTLTLFSGEGCHLCITAGKLLQPFVEGGACALERVDIASSDDLRRRYAIRIPVLQNENGEELFWPFDEQRLAAFIYGDSSA